MSCVSARTGPCEAKLAAVVVNIIVRVARRPRGVTRRATDGSRVAPGYKMIHSPITGHSTAGAARTARTTTDEIATHGRASTAAPTASTAAFRRHVPIIQKLLYPAASMRNRAPSAGKIETDKMDGGVLKTRRRRSRSELLRPTYHFCCLYVCVSTCALFLFCWRAWFVASFLACCLLRRSQRGGGRLVPSKGPFDGKGCPHRMGSPPSSSPPSPPSSTTTDHCNDIEIKARPGPRAF